MSSAPLAVLFTILAAGLASAAGLVLWRRGHASSLPASVVVPISGSRVPDELGRRLDELAARQRMLEARLARVEASATESPSATAWHPGGPRGGRRVDPGASATLGGPTLISVPDLAAPPASNSEAAAELDRRFGPVWAMADEGVAIGAIARETGYPIGQVELILGLRRRLLSAEAGPDA